MENDNHQKIYKLVICKVSFKMHHIRGNKHYNMLKLFYLTGKSSTWIAISVAIQSMEIIPCESKMAIISSLQFL